jgi:transposase
MNPEDLRQFSKEDLIALLLAQEARHAAEMAALRAQIAELERRLALNSGNSGKPPSSDGLRKAPRVRSLRRSSGRKSGGQPGHSGETLRQSETPDVTIDHYPKECETCGDTLSKRAATDYVARRVFDLPEPPPLVVTEHRAYACGCVSCGAQTRAGLPDDVAAPVQYGSRLASFVVYLLHAQFLPERRVVEVMADLFGVILPAATVAQMSRTCAGRFSGFAEMIRKLICAAPVKHLDETGMRISGKLHWLHIASTIKQTFYRIAGRGQMLAGLIGIVVHDHWKPYYSLEGVLHALCNAHHLRELQALVDIEKEPWAETMQRHLRRACHATNIAREHERSLEPKLVALIKRRYDAILAEAIAFHEAQPPLPVKRRGSTPRRTGHNLALRLSTFKQDVLRFLTDPTVPFTNNIAEHDARMAKLRQKISGGFRSLAGATDFVVLRSLISTARKQEWNILATLAAEPSTLASRLKFA